MSCGCVRAIAILRRRPGGPAAALLCGLGMMVAAIAIAALITIVSIVLVNALMWFGRLHYKVLQPAIEPETARSATS